MELAGQININDYDYNLPYDRIAKYPLTKRDSSKLLIGKDSNYSQDKFLNISDYLPANSLLVFNNTKVINARMHFAKETGAVIEVFCLQPISPIDYSLALATNTKCSWKCLVGNNRKWKSGSLTKKLEIQGQELSITISKLQQIGNTFEILFEWDNPNIHFSDILENSGDIPIPPYLNRKSEDSDKITYQTIYSKLQGSVAAPTAGLHFTDEVIKRIQSKNIKTDFITLHVGAGTFHPVKTDNAAEHKMHTEYFIINRNNIKNLIDNFGNITLVGTTSVRSLESLFVIACKVYNNPENITNEFQINQWEAYDESINTLKNRSLEILKHLYNWMQEHKLEQLNCSTQIMIVPGYKFVFTNRLITNFHQPKSTLLLLLAAFIGEREWQTAYKYALDNEFRFLSYGDSCVFL
ncbi:MAG: S-adenosylmethionine:tRNA ribosyltransferase-isomerase [Bacteroidales bacterium]|nr:S-adenosylmethionine:tRNA ribosyltransferase-isomerase [Bacteroidales bacterium]MDD4217546.1 S-adenosylmethionine:tRNA ribosyltransferase-isomerase [Bacteroidales bacterium]